MNWISVKDRLPEVNKNNWSHEPVLYYDGESIKFGNYWKDKNEFYDLDEQGGTRWGCVTHWMPLPEIPDAQP